jgi:hypothetical protein
MRALSVSACPNMAFVSKPIDIRQDLKLLVVQSNGIVA